MSEWNMNVQRIIDLAERGLRGELTLEDVPRRLGYSPWYCTRQFTRVVGMSFRSYLRLRRLSEAAAALRDGNQGILEVAVEFGFSSQEAFSRAFKAAWGMAPGAWRSHPRPLELVTRRYATPLPPEGGRVKNIGTIEIGIQAVPARKFIGIRVDGATDYLDFWAKAERSGWDCSRVEGILASITANAQIGGWWCSVIHLMTSTARMRPFGKRSGMRSGPTTRARLDSRGIPRSRRGSATTRPAWVRRGAVQ